MISSKKMPEKKGLASENDAFFDEFLIAKRLGKANFFFRVCYSNFQNFCGSWSNIREKKNRQFHRGCAIKNA